MQHVASADGTAIAYGRTGAGKPLVLVHGTTADHTRWAGVTPSLEQHFTVIAIDRRGRGGSGDDPAYSIAREAQDIAAVVDAAGGPAHVLGHSYGALCSLEAALLTTNIERLILYEPPLPTGLAPYPAGLPDRLQVLLDRGLPEEALVLFFRDVVRASESDLAAMRSLPMWQSRVAMAHTIPRELRLDEHYVFDPQRFARLGIPTLVLAGEVSPPFLRRAADVVCGALPAGRLVVLPGQAHVAMDTAPALFLTAVLDFLQP